MKLSIDRMQISGPNEGGKQYERMSAIAVSSADAALADKSVAGQM